MLVAVFTARRGEPGEDPLVSNGQIEVVWCQGDPGQLAVARGRPGVGAPADRLLGRAALIHGR